MCHLFGDSGSSGAHGAKVRPGCPSHSSGLWVGVSRGASPRAPISDPLLLVEMDVGHMWPSIWCVSDWWMLG